MSASQASAPSVVVTHHVPFNISAVWRGFRIGWRKLVLVLGIVLAGILVVALLVDFVYDLMRLDPDKTADAAVALGGVLGGALGACGAGLAVYLSLQVQRREDARRADAAIRREVEELTRFALAQLRRCKQIRFSKLKISYEELRQTMAPPKSVVYRVVADRIGLVEDPVALMKYYRQLRETSARIRGMAPDGDGRELVDRARSDMVAHSWLRVCRQAQKVIKVEDNGRTVVARGQARILRRIAEALAEWDRYFKPPAPPGQASATTAPVGQRVQDSATVP